MAQKAEAHLVQDEFNKVRHELGNELAKAMRDADIAGTNAKFANIGDMVSAFGAQVQEAFQHVSAVEASFQTHVSQGVEEAVSALQWLEGSLSDRCYQIDQKITQVEAAACSATYLPPPARHPAPRPVPSARAAGRSSAFPLRGFCRRPLCMRLRKRRNCWRRGLPRGGSPEDQSGGPPGIGRRARSTPGRDAGECHCHHVTKLQEEIAAVKMQLAHMKTSFGAKPLIPARDEAPSPVEGAGGPAIDRGVLHESLPLELGPTGHLATGRILDNKIAGQPEFQFSTHKGGEQWKGKTERYLMSVVPAVYAIFTWPEKQELPITQEKYEGTVGLGLSTWDRDGNETDHWYALNSAIWGFLSNCVSGKAQTIFKKADTLMGVEAWRRISRFIDHGREIRS